MTETFTDWEMSRGNDGIYDLVIDEDMADLKPTSGIATALFCSLFSDRRARVDEVAEPMKRRGWIGNLTATMPGDNYGSGLWLYEQRRMTGEVRAAIRLEAINALQWLIDEGLGQTVDVLVDHSPSARKLTIAATVTDVLGGITKESFEIWQNTTAGNLARL